MFDSIQILNTPTKNSPFPVLTAFSSAAMEIAELSPVLILREVLRHLGLPQAVYAHAMVADGHHQTSVHLSLPPALTQDQTAAYCIMGKLSNTLLGAEKDAAYHTLLFLQQTTNLQVRDYSYLLLTKLRQIIRRISTQHLTMANEIQTLLNGWEKMSIQLYASSSNLEDTLLSYFSSDRTRSYSGEICTMLSHIKQLARTVQNSSRASPANIKQFEQQYFNLYRCLSSDNNSVAFQTPGLFRLFECFTCLL